MVSVKEQNQEYYYQATRNNPIERFTQPSEVARVVEFLCEEGSVFINDVVFPIDNALLEENKRREVRYGNSTLYKSKCKTRG